jgi:hypothetical protein
MAQDGRNSRFWPAVAARLAVVVLLGWLSVLWFQGCLVPRAKDEMRREQEKALDRDAPPR